MSVFFHGAYHLPGGPSQVNRNMVKYIKGQADYKHGYRNRIFDYAENFLKIIKSHVIVFSGLLFKPYELKLAKLLGKKVIYIAHGCAYIESQKALPIENEIISKADLILCVSENFCKILKQTFPEYGDKMNVLRNGIEWNEIPDLLETQSSQIIRDQKRIILLGGGRRTKRNMDVCRAVQEINDEMNMDYHVDVYGYFKDSDDSKAISEIPSVTFHNVIPHNMILVEMAKSHLFIQNSEFESFSLALIDALQCGCDILVSKNVGAIEIIPGLKDDDVIRDPGDVNEIKDKIKKVLIKENSERLLSSIDKNSSSAETAVSILMKYCRQYEK